MKDAIQLFSEKTKIPYKEVEGVINKICRAMAKKFTIPSCEKEDILQEAHLHALEALPNFDPARASRLSSFLYTHVKNRICNMVRDTVRRNDSPCKICHQAFLSSGISSCSKRGEEEFCQKYQKWKKSQDSKAALVYPGKIAYDIAKAEKFQPDVFEREILQRIDKELPLEMRADWLMLLAGVSPGKANTEVLIKKIREIISSPSPSTDEEE